MAHPPLRCVVSVSGFRGIVGDTIDAPTVLALAMAYGRSIARGRPVILGRDSRPTGPHLAEAVAAGLQSVGCDVVDLGIVPTPTVAIAMRSLKAGGGIQVSASHNPEPWNALKCFAPDGRGLNAPQLQRLLKAYAAPSPETCRPWDEVGERCPYAGALDDHLERVLAAVDGDRIAAAGLTVVVDSVNGAGGTLAAMLMQALGVRLIPLYDNPAAPFPRNPEPTAANVRETGKVVRAVSADCGFVQDPDADRLAIIDGRGRYLGEEFSLVLCAAARLATARKAGSRRPVAVTNLSTSRMLDDVAARHHARVVRTAVGEANVVDGMQAAAAVIGGEGNGGIIDPRVVWGRDSHIGMALVLEAMASRQGGLPELLAEIPTYAMRKEKIDCDRAGVLRVADALKASGFTAGATLDERDGIKCTWHDRWVHLRASGTEPMSRIMAEAPLAATANHLTAVIRQAVLKDRRSQRE